MIIVMIIVMIILLNLNDINKIIYNYISKKNLKGLYKFN